SSLSLCTFSRNSARLWGRSRSTHLQRHLTSPCSFSLSFHFPFRLRASSEFTSALLCLGMSCFRLKACANLFAQTSDQFRKQLTCQSSRMSRLVCLVPFFLPHFSPAPPPSPRSAEPAQGSHEH